MSFEGDLAQALAVSFQQCAGNANMEMDLIFNSTASLVDATDVGTSRCARVSGLLVDIMWRALLDT